MTFHKSNFLLFVCGNQGFGVLCRCRCRCGSMGLNVSQKLLSTICVDVWGLGMFVFPREVTRNDFYLTWGYPIPDLGGTPCLVGGYPVMGYPRLGLGYPHPLERTWDQWKYYGMEIL